MVQFEDTKLEIIGFGEAKEDIFYFLVDLNVSPDGIDAEKLSQTDPRELDDELDKMGCLLMITGEDLESFLEEENITETNLHKAIYEKAVEEQIIS